MTAGTTAMPQAGDTTRRSTLFAPLLRTWRELAGFTYGEAGVLIGCDKSKISRLETGDRLLTLRDLKALLHVYGFRDREFTALLHAGRDSTRDWWAGCPQVMTGDFARYALLELAAPRILVYQPSGVPDLLQAPRWALAAARLDPAVPDAEEETRALAVLARQDAVLGGPCPPQLHAILSGRLPAGAVSTPDMTEQVTKINRGPHNVTARFIPDTDAALAAAGPFTIAQFGTGPARGVVHLPGPAGGTLITEPGMVRAYTGLFASLDRAARLHRHTGQARRETSR